MDYHVRPLGKTCAATGEELSPGTVCHSVLIERNGEQVRLDFSQAGWAGAAPEGAIAHWVTTLPEEEHSDAPRPLDPEELFQFFEQLLDDMNPAQEKIKYMLALLLMQKKRLRLDGTLSDDDGDRLLLSGSQGEGPYEIRDQNLSGDEIEQLQRELNSAIFR